jgi:hypothetical protein
MNGRGKSPYDAQANKTQAPGLHREFRPHGAIQPKRPEPSQPPTRGPVAPPVYRPNPEPRVLQRKAARGPEPPRAVQVNRDATRPKGPQPARPNAGSSAPRAGSLPFVPTPVQRRQPPGAGLASQARAAQVHAPRATPARNVNGPAPARAHGHAVQRMRHNNPSVPDLISFDDAPTQSNNTPPPNSNSQPIPLLPPPPRGSRALPINPGQRGPTGGTAPDLISFDDAPTTTVNNNTTFTNNNNNPTSTPVPTQSSNTNTQAQRSNPRKELKAKLQAIAMQVKSKISIVNKAPGNSLPNSKELHAGADSIGAEASKKYKPGSHEWQMEVGQRSLQYGYGVCTNVAAATYYLISMDPGIKASGYKASVYWASAMHAYAVVIPASGTYQSSMSVPTDAYLVDPWIDMPAKKSQVTKFDGDWQTSMFFGGLSSGASLQTP